MYKDLLDAQGNLNKGELHKAGATIFDTTDFLTAGGYHLARDKWVGLYYAEFAKERSPDEDVALMQISIPTEVIDNLSADQRMEIYFPDEMWKKLIWYSRGRGTRRDPNGVLVQPPPGVERLLQATLIIGNIATSPDRKYLNMPSWRDITNNYVLKAEHGRSPLQYVIPESQDWILKDHGKFKLFELKGSEHRGWLQEQYREAQRRSVMDSEQEDPQRARSVRRPD